jgi:hypothetical protein
MMPSANAILPEWIRSEMIAGIMANEKFVSNVMPRIPMPRFGERKISMNRHLSGQQDFVQRLNHLQGRPSNALRNRSI